MVFSVIIIVLILLLLIAFGIIHFTFRQITQMRLQTTKAVFDYLEGTGVYTKERFESLDKCEVHVTSRDGLKLSGYVLEYHPKSPRWVIIVHGYTVSLFVSTQYIDMFQEKDFNILLIDQRRHGMSEGKYTTYGFKEKYDVDVWVKWILEHYGDHCVIGLHGQSFGGGTVLEYLSIANPHVKFVVADCPYSDLTELIRYQLTVLNKIPKIPAFPLLSIVDRYMQRKAGFRLGQVSPLKAVEHSRLPVFFIHGTEDRYVPTHMSQDLYNHKPDPKRLQLVKDAVHGNAFGVDPQQYTHEVHTFIDEALNTVT